MFEFSFFSGCSVDTFQVEKLTPIREEVLGDEVEVNAMETTSEAQLDDIEAELMNLEITDEDFSDL